MRCHPGHPPPDWNPYAIRKLGDIKWTQKLHAAVVFLLVRMVKEVALLEDLQLVHPKERRRPCTRC